MYRVVNQYIYIYICGKPETERRYWPVSKYLISMAKPKRVLKRYIQFWLKYHFTQFQNRFLILSYLYNYTGLSPCINNVRWELLLNRLDQSFRLLHLLIFHQMSHRSKIRNHMHLHTSQSLSLLTLPLFVQKHSISS